MSYLSLDLSITCSRFCAGTIAYAFVRFTDRRDFRFLLLSSQLVGWDWRIHLLLLLVINFISLFSIYWTICHWFDLSNFALDVASFPTLKFIIHPIFSTLTTSRWIKHWWVVTEETKYAKKLSYLTPLISVITYDFITRWHLNIADIIIRIWSFTIAMRL